MALSASVFETEITKESSLRKTGGSVKQLADYFHKKSSSLQQNIDVLYALASEPEALSVYNAVNTELQELEAMLVCLRASVAEREKGLSSFEVIKVQLTELNCRLKDKLKQFPASTTVPTLTSVQKPNSGDAVSVACYAEGSQGKLSTPMYRNSKGRLVESPVLDSGDEAADGEVTPMLTGSEIRKKAPTLFMPSIEHLSKEEFLNVPKYMKGRLTIEQINSAADELNKAVSCKYELLQTSRSKQTDGIKAAIRAYKNQELPETNVWDVRDDSGRILDCHFCHLTIDGGVESKLRNRKLDKISRNILVILRHCARIREVRGQGLVRYVIL